MHRLPKGILLLCLGSLPFLAEAAGNLPAVRQSLQAGRPYVSGELLVQFRPEASPSSQRLVFGRFAAQAVERVQARGAGHGDLWRVRLGGNAALTPALLERLSADSSVDFVEPNWIYRHQDANPSDPYLGSLWGMQGAATAPANPYGSGALALWNAGRRCDSQVVVGVIDEGLMIGHPELQPAVWVNPGEAGQRSGVDDDGNGYVDDLNGWDFNANDASVYDGSGDDHGSHVAGTVAAAINNGLGVFGVCPGVRLISAKFLGPRGGTTANAVKAVNYLTDLKSRHHLRLVASNNSWGGGGYSQALYNAIAAAGAADILFVAAAGNAGVNIDSSPSYPASYALPNVLAVAAIDKSGAKASFSNWGTASVAIAAPGVDILSTVPTRKGEPGYASYSGTSMATPHVTGAAAFYASLNPCASAAQIKSALLAKATSDARLSAYVQNGRRLDLSGFARELSCP